MSGDRPELMLGFGTATLMREPSRKKRLALLALAYDLGIRHFDTAPSYGLGQAELDLGRVAQKHADLQVATKFGLQPSALARMLRPVQRPLRSALAASSKLRAHSKERSAAALSATDPGPMAVRRSIETSLRRLRRESVEIVFAHELAPSALSDDTVAALVALRDGGCIATLGMAGSARLLSESSRLVPEPFAVIQTDELEDSGIRSAGFRRRFRYGVLSQRMSLYDLLDSNEEVRRELEEVLDVSVRSKREFGEALLLIARIQQPDSITVVGTTNAANLRAAVHATERTLPPSRESLRAVELIDYLENAA